MLGVMDDDLHPVPQHELLFNVEQALRKARKLWPRRRVEGNYNPLRPVANAVVEHLALCGIRCFRKPPAIGHSTPIRPYGPAHRDQDPETPGT